MILGSSYEFEKSSNPEIIERPSDNIEIPPVNKIVVLNGLKFFFETFFRQLMKELPDLQEKIRELPYSYMYSIKARALIHAHLLRMPLPVDTLQKGF